MSENSNSATNYNHLQNIVDKLKLLCDIAHYGKSLISVFQWTFASTDKIFISGEGLSTRQQFYKDLKFS